MPTKSIVETLMQLYEMSMSCFQSTKGLNFGLWVSACKGEMLALILSNSTFCTQKAYSFSSRFVFHCFAFGNDVLQFHRKAAERHVGVLFFTDYRFIPSPT